MINFYSFAKHGTWILAHALGRVEVEGLENLPSKGGVILAPNHLHLADPPVLSAFLPRKIYFMVKQEAWDTPFVGLIPRWFEAFPVRRGEVDLNAYRQALRLLADGQVVGIFPEGHRSVDGRLHAGQPGAVVLAQRSGVPIVPVGIWGIKEVLTHPIVLRQTIHLRVGQPFHPTLARRGQLQAAIDDLMARIAALLPPERRSAPLLDRSGSSSPPA
ncbi:MAG TPA: lysophospholipid acyltransferase family protein [Chloroflexota bacterium]|jgi:1-acyl-sn-glycerol-3-phosphate acyltransferase|nr:lysophospholipid acyltransferase family protein [Chloroflexota bacterium]